MTTWFWSERGRHVEDVDQQPLGVAVDRLGTGDRRRVRVLPRGRTRPALSGP